MTVRSFHLDTCTNRLLPVAEDMVIRPQGGFVLHNEELIHSSLSLTHTHSHSSLLIHQYVKIGQRKAVHF